MKKLVFATHNQHKTEEVKKMLPDYEVLNLTAIGCHEDIPETANSFEGNAQLKSNHVAHHYKLDCFADDSGLEVEALNNEPGIFSARYSGVKDDQANLDFLLQKMEGVANRKARFKTVISLIMGGEQHFFEGSISGTLRTVATGSHGFGYDPIFQPDGYDITFAEMDLAKKNKISHRALAVQQLIAFLNAVAAS